MKFRRNNLLISLVVILVSHPVSTFSVGIVTGLTRQPRGGGVLEQMFAPISADKGQRRTALKNASSPSPRSSEGFGAILDKAKLFANKNFFLVGMFVAVALARMCPSLGSNGGVLRPELFIGKYGVTLIFLLSGLALELSQLSAAASNFKLNSLIQLGTFAAWPYLIGLPIKFLFSKVFLTGLFPDALLDGLLILTCLPTTVNMCVILTTASGGNTASALCNAIISNMAGIFLTPALLFRFFGATIELPFIDMSFKLCSKVLLPVAIGQVLRVTPVKKIYDSNSKRFKRLQELILLSILWNAFCTAITNSIGLSWNHGLALVLLLPTVHILSLGVLFKLFSLPALKFAKGDVIAAMFCASQKTLAFGLPLINTIFEGNPNVATYCAPLMLVHPLQLMVGSALVTRLEKYSRGEMSSP